MRSLTSSFSLGLEANTVGGAELIGLVDHAVSRVGGQLHLLLKQEHEVSDPWLLVSIGSRKLTVTWTPPAPPPGPTPAWGTFRDETNTRVLAGLRAAAAVGTGERRLCGE